MTVFQKQNDGWLWVWEMNMILPLLFTPIHSHLQDIKINTKYQCDNSTETVTGHFFLPCPALPCCPVLLRPVLPWPEYMNFVLPCPALRAGQGRAGRPQGFYTNWMFTMFIQVCWKTEKSPPCSSGFPIRGGGGWFPLPQLEICLPFCKNF